MQTSDSVVCLRSKFSDHGFNFHLVDWLIFQMTILSDCSTLDIVNQQMLDCFSICQGCPPSLATRWLFSHL